VDIVVLGAGVIGTTYGLAWQQAGHRVSHLVRPERLADYPRRLRVQLLDGRTKPPTRHEVDHILEAATDADLAAADFVFVSVPGHALAGAIETVVARGLQDRLVLFSGGWETRAELDVLVTDQRYVLGYPIAGGAIDGDLLRAVLFDSVKLESARPETQELHDRAERAFRDARINPEPVSRMLEWLWIHEAINAGIISAIAASAREGDPLAVVVERALADRHTLARGIGDIRECLRVVQGRGVRLRDHRTDVLPYYLPRWLGSRLMVRLFATQELSREIMLLHHNVADLTSLVADVSDAARAQGLRLPGFEADVRAFERFVDRHWAAATAAA
jgi:2-dehydropantoate 2-reductase